MLNRILYKTIKFFCDHDSDAMELSDRNIKDLVKGFEAEYSARQNVHSIMSEGGKIYFVSNTRNKPVKIFAFEDSDSISLLIKIMVKLGFSFSNANTLLKIANQKTIYKRIGCYIYCISVINDFYSIDSVKI